MNQLEWVYSQLHKLSASTLVEIIDELECEIAENEYSKMATDVYNLAKSGAGITHKQKRVLVNIIGQPPSK